MMAEFSGLEESWGDLQAIVGGGGSFTGRAFYGSTGSMVSAVPNSCYGVMDLPRDDHDDLIFSFPDLFETSAMLTDELEGLYKPFFPVLDPLALSAESVLASPVSVLPGEGEEKSEEAEKKQICSPVPSAIGSAVAAYVPKYKRRKNQQKRVVLQVSAEDLSSDMWAWRKYGQKPIKGSPYPRSYYRCSSSKGCLARKQVEQSCADPSIFIITYSAEHNHSQPTRKNALAGTVRQKFPNSKSPPAATSKAAKAKDSRASPASSSTAVLSPRTPLVVSIHDNEYDPRNVKQEMTMEEIGREIMIDGNDDNVIFSGIKLDDDFFSGLEDLDELISELSNGHCSSKQFPMS